MYASTIVVAQTSYSTGTTLYDIAARLGLDVLVLLVLVGVLYRRRHTNPEMPLVFTALNLGLFAALTAFSAGHFPTGIGFGLFGVLSLVRLRSAAFTIPDVAYTFIALVIALIGGLAHRPVYLTAALDVALLIAVMVIDNPRLHRSTRVVRITLDRLYPNSADIAPDVIARFGVVPLDINVVEIDSVREVTRVAVRYAADTPAMITGEAPTPAGADVS